MSRLAARSPAFVKFIAVAACVALAAPLPAVAQAAARGGGTDVDAANIDCSPGNITCLAHADATCRSTGGFLGLSMSMASAVMLRCEPDRHDLDEVFDGSQAQTDTCTAGHLCLRHGTRTGDETNVYRRLVGMMNTCLQSGGRLEVQAIMPDGPNTSTVYAGCLPRS